MIGAILRAQFLSLLRIGRGGVLGTVVLLFWYGLWIFLSVAAGMAFAGLTGNGLAVSLTLTLAGVCAYWQLTPIVTASVGASLDMRKLLAYPVPRRKLFVLEILLRLISAAEMFLVLAGITTGLCLNSEVGGVRAAPRVIAAFVLFVLFNLLLASGMRSVLERFLSRRRVREVVAIVMAMVWVLPRFLTSSGFRGKSLAGPWATLRIAGFPWSATAGTALSHQPWTNLAGLGVWAAAAFWFGRSQFERNLRFDALAAHATPAKVSTFRGDPWIERFFRWPRFLWRDPLAAIVEKELRSLARSPRFRMVFIMGFTFGLLVWFPVFVGRRGQASDSPYFLVVVCMYSLSLLGQACFWNCFGSDRGATAFYFAAPQPLSRVLLGKNIAAMVYIYLETVILTGVTIALGLAHGWATPVETLAVVGIAAIYMLGAGNINSVWYPRASDPERVMQGGSGGKSPGIVFLLYVLAMIPIALAYLARYALNSDVVFVLMLVAAAVGGTILYISATKSAVQRALSRREQLLSELSKGEGPVAVE